MIFNQLPKEMSNFDRIFVSDCSGEISGDWP